MISYPKKQYFLTELEKIASLFNKKIVSYSKNDRFYFPQNMPCFGF